MPTRDEINQKCQVKAANLEQEFYRVVDKGLPTQHRELREGKSLADFQSQHAAIWDAHEQALIDAGYMDPPESPSPATITHWARVSALVPSATKPLEVKRNWQGQEVTVDCYVTEDLVDLYQANELSVGDFVLVVFVDGDRDKPCAVQKVYKSW